MIENNLDLMYKDLYRKFFCLYFFYVCNLIISIIIINYFKEVSCILFNFNLYVDLVLKSLILIQILYIYIKRIYSINYIFFWKSLSSLSFICYPLFLFIVESQKNICKEHNVLFIYFCIFSSIFFFIIMKTGNNNLFIQENNECIICIDNIPLVDKVRINICGHIFHRNCILTWFMFNYSCPTCRIRCSTENLRSP